MPIVIGVFGDATQLQEALTRLEDEGFGSQVVREEAEESSGTAPRESDLGLAPGANQAGALTTLEASSDLELLDLTAEEHEFLQLALDRGGEMVAIDTDQVEAVVGLLQELNAQQIRDPR